MPKQSPTGRKTPAKGGSASGKAGKSTKSGSRPAAKPAPKQVKSVAKPEAGKTGAAKAPAKPAPAAVKPGAKTPAKAPGNGKKAATPAPAAKPAPTVDAGKSGRKGITIVDNKPVKKGKKEGTVIPNFGGGLLRPGGPVRKPLIQSGPQAPAAKAWGAQPTTHEMPVGKSPFNKKELARFKEILLQKRSQLVGDVSNMEDEALRSASGSLSNLPQHMADQGSDAYDQALSLDIAAADRRLIKEIDDAIARIEKGTYGVCQLTGKPIRAERLEELPWARYSIEAARELERRPTNRP